MTNPRSTIPRLLLAKVREGDFAHAGDKEAVDLTFEELRNLQNNDLPLNILDVGCGFGGTAAYVQEKKLGQVSGIDVDNKALEYAKKTYLNIKFYNCDVLKVDSLFPKTSFDLIYLFNVFYNLDEQKKSLQQLANIAKPEAILIIFDYTVLNSEKIAKMTDLAGKQMQPLRSDRIKEWLNTSGWEIVKEINVSSKYIDWYREFINKLILKKQELLQEFTEETFNKILDVFQAILHELNEKNLGGTILYSKHHSLFNSNTFVTEKREDTAQINRIDINM
jgi:ubiquinone/menaquinone biosynthesis C-methylase UbiE